MPLHTRNAHQGQYDLKALVEYKPELEAFLITNPAGQWSVDFSQPEAVLALNQALLAKCYQIQNWHVPEGYLCPPIPGRADYIHHLADLLADGSEVPRGKKVKVLDIGTGANVIYPILGQRIYGWSFVGSDSQAQALKISKVNIDANPRLRGTIQLRHQKDGDAIFKGIIGPRDRFALTMCNPPFYHSAEHAKVANQRKVNNLNRARAKLKKGAAPQQMKAGRNFGGQPDELYCKGGEIGFLIRMAKESVAYGKQVGWFTSLVSKGDNMKTLKRILNELDVQDTRVIQMGQGQKTSRIIAWRF